MANLPRWLLLSRPAPLVALVALLALPAGCPTGGDPDRTSDLRAALAERGLRAETVAWMTPSAHGLLARDAVAMALARRGDGPRDVWFVRARETPEGRILDIESAYNVSHTSAADESGLRVHDRHAAWVIGSANSVYRVELADASGTDAPTEWPTTARLQHALTNWQRTGSFRGIARRSFKLEPAAKDVALQHRDDALTIVADGHDIVVPHDRRRPVVGARYVVEEDRELARPGNLVTWAVDRARESSWFGNERMQWIKAVAYSALDVVERALGSVRRDDSLERIDEELGGVPTPAVAMNFDAVKVGWPPPPIRPVFSEPLEREGKWRLLADDPFITSNPDAPPPVATSFVRTDEDRKYSRIFVAMWDPRQVDLHLMPGTEEPQSATGRTGAGLIPRKPEVLTRLVAAFNGGFQSTHGDYGMMVDGDVLVPPRPYAATIALLDDGTTGLGTWPHDPSIDARFVAFRQNLTPLVAGGELNPYGRLWWGGVPQGWEDETRTVRSGLCVTKQGFLAYFYGSKVDHEHLGVAMQSAHCTYGVHLDMNQGHTGFEFYRVGTAKDLPSLGRLDGIWQAEGDVRGLDGYRFRGRRLIKHMQLMHFPRYIRRSQRDFFYLTLRHLLPHAKITTRGAEGDEGAWRVEGLPQHGWPHAIAMTELRPDPTRPETKVRVLAIDPKFVEPTRPTDETPVVLSLGHDAAESGPTLFHDRRSWTVSAPSPSPTAVAVIRGSERPQSDAEAIIGIDPLGMAIYAEVATGRDPARDRALLDALLDRLDARARIYFATRPTVAVAGVRDLGGHPVVSSPTATMLGRFSTPEVRRLFEQTPILPRADWRPLQQQRRFFAPSGIPSAEPPPE